MVITRKKTSKKKVPSKVKPTKDNISDKAKPYDPLECFPPANCMKCDIALGASRQWSWNGKKLTGPFCTECKNIYEGN